MYKKLFVLGCFVFVCGYSYCNTYKASNNAINLIKDVEGCSLSAYWDSNGYSIGYGRHSNVSKNDKICKQTAVKYLKEDIRESERYVNYLIKKLPYKYKFSQGFIDGFVSFVYNVGVGNAEKSEFYKRLQRCRVKNGVMNQSDFNFTIATIKTSYITSKGHIDRRKKEYNLMRNK